MEANADKLVVLAPAVALGLLLIVASIKPLNALLLGIPGLLFPAQLQCRGCGAIFKQ